MGLTPAQERVYRFIENYLKIHRHAPSYDEIREHLGFRSLNAVHKHLKQLERRGYLKSPWNNQKRALELVPLNTGADSSTRAASIPFLGVVAAGIPIEVIEIPEAIEVPESFLGNGNNFALRVRGDSMIEEGIRDGDILIVTKRVRAENGQTVVALVNGEATVKKFYVQRDEVELRPANSEMESLYMPAREVEIVGVVMGLLRNYRHRMFAGS